MYGFLSKLYPKNIRIDFTRALRYSDLKIEPHRFIGFILFFGIGLSLAFSLFIASFTKFSFFLLFIVLFLLFEFLTYISLILKADKKGRFVETILPDALQLMASNLRAGLTTDKALLLSARPEFGPFQNEINSIGKEVTMGKDISSALLLMTERIKSERLKKTVLLINSGLKSGGELAALLEQTANNLRQQRFVEERIRSSVMMYVIFIFVAIGFGSPLLFGLSSFLIEVLTTNLASIQLPTTQLSSSLPLLFKQVSISPDFIITFALTSLITSSILGSLILGLISKGKERRGIRFVPVLIIVSLSVFFITRTLIKGILGSLFGL